MKLIINKTEIKLDVPDEMPLLWVIRDYAGLPATKYGCGIGICGACTVHVDGVPLPSCQLPVSSLTGKDITTLEGADSETAHQVKGAWQDLQVPQCGYCQPGQMMSAIALLENNPRPDDKAIDDAMSGNICRCGTYPKIRQAINKVAGQD
jgi:isoquinoline 1-oxidoreductase alpha subunit